MLGLVCVLESTSNFPAGCKSVDVRSFRTLVAIVGAKVGLGVIARCKRFPCKGAGRVCGGDCVEAFWWTRSYLISSCLCLRQIPPKVFHPYRLLLHGIRVVERAQQHLDGAGCGRQFGEEGEEKETWRRWW